jgi:hypothetical protein
MNPKRKRKSERAGEKEGSVKEVDKKGKREANHEISY